MEKLTDVFFQTAYKPHNVPKEQNSGEVKTVPDQTPSMRMILDRHQRGIPVEEKIGTYNESYIYPDIRKMDLVEVQELKMELKEQQNELSEQIKTYQDEITRRKTPTPPNPDPAP